MCMSDRISRYVLLIFLIIIGVGIYFRASEALPFEDDFCYSFRILTDEEMARDTPLTSINSIQDIFEGQIIHYQMTNGRGVVHTLVQIFDGFHLSLLFRIVNSVIFVLTVLLMLRLIEGLQLTINSGMPVKIIRIRNHLGIVIFVTGVLLFCMPECGELYYAPALSINYLWTLFMTLSFLVLWKNCEKWISWCWAILLMPLMFIMGWSHEIFCLPTAGALLFYYLAHRREWRKPRMLLALAYCFGALMILCSPGNYLRFSKGEGSPGILSWLFHHTLDFISNPWTMLMIPVVIILFYKNRCFLNSYVRQNLLMVMIYLLGQGLIFFLGVTGRGRFEIDIFGFMIMVSVIIPYGMKGKNSFNKMFNYITPAIGVIIILFQWMIIFECKAQRDRYDMMIERYLRDESGFVEIEEGEVSNTLLSPWVRVWESDMNPRDEFDVYRRNLMKYYYRHPYLKPLTTLNRYETEELRSGGLFKDKSKRIDGTAGFYRDEGMNHYFLPYDSIGVENPEFEVEYKLSDITKLPYRKRIKSKIYGISKKDILPIMKIEVDKRLYYIAIPAEDYPVEKININY